MLDGVFLSPYHYNHNGMKQIKMLVEVYIVTVFYFMSICCHDKLVSLWYEMGFQEQNPNLQQRTYKK